jgi:two-component system chemotaxis sensor kinase CheA
VSSPSEEIIARFRTLALARIDRLEAGWNALIAHGGDANLSAEILRELHTLKGDSRLVGFVDVNLLCHKLEDLFELAARRNYRVPDDVDLVVGMGLRFLATLVRKKAGASMGGIDLHGFVAQIEGVLRETSGIDETNPPAPHTEAPEKPSIPSDQPTPEEVRERVSAAASAVYLEHLQARGPTKNRLASAWNILKQEIAAMGSVSVATAIAHVEAGGKELAHSLGKSVRIEREVGRLRVQEATAEALALAVTHAIRNAIDHGIEAPASRTAGGKAAEGLVTVRARVEEDRLEITIEDDGAGIDFDAVRRRAGRSGLSDAELANLLFEPGFSTARALTDVSGRGVGLDAVKNAVVRVGGAVEIASRHGQGTTLSLSFREEGHAMDVHFFRSSPSGLPFAVPATWGVTAVTAPPSGAPDPFVALGIDVEVTSPRTPTVFELRHGDRTFRVLALDPPTPAVAERPCPTGDSHPFEVVDVSATEVVLVRPHLLRNLQGTS